MTLYIVYMHVIYESGGLGWSSLLLCDLTIDMKRGTIFFSDTLMVLKCLDTACIMYEMERECTYVLAWCVYVCVSGLNWRGGVQGEGHFTRYELPAHKVRKRKLYTN